MPRILYILLYISSVTSTLDNTSLVSTNAVSIHGPSYSVGKIVTFTNYMVTILVSSLSLTTFEHYENLANTYSNSIRIAMLLHIVYPHAINRQVKDLQFLVHNQRCLDLLPHTHYSGTGPCDSRDLNRYKVKGHESNGGASKRG